MRTYSRPTAPRPTTPGFCCVITEDMELSGAMLIEESPSWGRGYRPLGQVISVNEAVEIANSAKIRPDADLVLWATGRDGYMAIAAHLFRDEKTGRYRAQICS